jgi:hypothetical protein
VAGVPSLRFAEGKPGGFGKQFPADACGGHLTFLPGPYQVFIKYSINEFGERSDFLNPSRNLKKHPGFCRA